LCRYKKLYKMRGVACWSWLVPSTLSRSFEGEGLAFRRAPIKLYPVLRWSWGKWVSFGIGVTPLKFSFFSRMEVGNLFGYWFVHSNFKLFVSPTRPMLSQVATALVVQYLAFESNIYMRGIGRRWSIWVEQFQLLEYYQYIQVVASRSRLLKCCFGDLLRTAVLVRGVGMRGVNIFAVYRHFNRNCASTLFGFNFCISFFVFSGIENCGFFYDFRFVASRFVSLDVFGRLKL